jgi:hypothetical protein
MMGQQSRAASFGIHVTIDLRLDPGPAPISDYQLPSRPGDNTPRIMGDWGQESCRAWLADPRIIWDGEKVNGTANMCLDAELATNDHRAVTRAVGIVVGAVTGSRDCRSAGF